jgi:hypothetical protein
MVNGTPVIDRSNGRLDAVVGDIRKLIQTLEELDRFDTNRIAAQMTRVVAIEANMRYWMALVGLAVYTMERAGSLPQIHSLTELQPSHDEMVAQPDLLAEEDWHLGFMYSLGLLSDVIGAVVERERHAGSHSTERDITVVALKRLYNIYSGINEKKPIGRPRLAQLAKVLLYPLMPESYRPDPLTLARVVLGQVRQGGGKRVREEVAIGQAAMGNGQHGAD